MSASLSSALYNFDAETCKNICEAALKKPEIVKITIWSQEKQYLILSDDIVSDPGQGNEIKVFELPISAGKEKIGKVEIAVTTALLNENISRLKKSIFSQVILLDIILGLVLVFVLNIRFVRPLKKLRQSSEKIAAGHLDASIKMYRNDELGALADNLAAMRDAVKDKVDSLVAEAIQHQKTSLALEKSESFLRLIIDLIPHMIFVKDTKGKFLIANQAVGDDLGLTVEKVIGRHHSEITRDPKLAAKLLKDDQTVIQEGKILSLVTNTKDSSSEKSKWLATKKIPFSAPDGDKGVVGITIDITDIKRAEEELKKTKNYIDNIINSMPSALFSLDRDLKIVLWNRKSEKYFGLSSKEAVNKSISEILPKMEPLKQQIANTIETGKPYYLPKYTDASEKGVTYQEITAYPLMSQTIEGAVIRVDDITEQVRMEEMVVQSEKMMSVGGLAAGMAHEINNPLAGMMQNAQMVLRRIQRPIPASIDAAEEAGTSLEQIQSFMEKRGVIRQLELIHEAGVRAAKIVRNMLSFSRKEYAGKSLQDLGLLLDQTIELAKSDYNLRSQYDFKKIKIVKAYDPQTPLVECEVSKIQQVFFNILKNSAEAMLDAGSIQEAAFYLSVKPHKNFVRVEIQDNGPGMEETVRKRIFEPFFTTKPVGEGTGLGLSVSYFIITDNHHGKMNVVSAPGKGASFIIQLPIRDVSKPSADISQRPQ